MGLPPFVTILDGGNMNLFWGYVKWFLFLVAPLVMIWVAVELVGRFTRVVKTSVEDEDEDYRRRSRYDDYDEY